ncbi:6-hydroxy-D-nicotine oxidase, partial [Candidatus Parcubacteria bacterium]
MLDNNRAGALHVYHACAAVLEQEFGAEPDPTTRQLYEQISETRSGQPLAFVPAPASGPSLSLVGRHQEWGQLQEAWQTAQNDPPYFVCIGGEAGIGKTRLAEELLAWAGKLNISTAAAQCYAGAGGLAYEPVATWLRAQAIGPGLDGLDDVWFHELTRLLPERAAERPHLPAPGPIDQAWQRQRMFDAFVRTICRGQALILLLDDLQWIDRETLHWLSYLSQQELDAPLLVVCGLRTDQIGPDHPARTFLRQLERLNRLTSI